MIHGGKKKREEKDGGAGSGIAEKRGIAVRTLARVGKKDTLSEIQCNDGKKTFLQSRKEDFFFHAREFPELSLSPSLAREGRPAAAISEKRGRGSEGGS